MLKINNNNTVHGINNDALYTFPVLDTLKIGDNSKDFNIWSQANISKVAITQDTGWRGLANSAITGVTSGSASAVNWIAKTATGGKS